MPRILKFFFNVILALLAVGITFLVIFFLRPGWQQAALERLMEADPQRQWQVESVDLSPGQVLLEGLFVLDGPVGLEVEKLQLEGPFWSIPLRRQLSVKTGDLTGIFLDLSEVKVGDLTSRDWQEFVQRVAEDEDFWEERVDLVLSKASAVGLDIRLENVEVSGEALLPGGLMVPVRWRIVEADSGENGVTKLEPLGPAETVESQLL